MTTHDIQQLMDQLPNLCAEGFGATSCYPEITAARRPLEVADEPRVFRGVCVQRRIAAERRDGDDGSLEAGGRDGGFHGNGARALFIRPPRAVQAANAPLLRPPPTSRASRKEPIT